MKHKSMPSVIAVVLTLLCRIMLADYWIEAVNQEQYYTGVPQEIRSRRYKAN